MVGSSRAGNRARIGRRAFLFTLATACLLLAQPAWADKPAPLSAQTLKSPSGPASLKGLGESFSANPGTGTGSYSVPIALPPGFVVPVVALKYMGGNGKSEVGVGFRLPVLQVYRQTDKGAPSYTEDDRFAVSGPEYNDELVLADSAKRLYRLKNEGAFALFQRDSVNDRWVVLLPNGVRSVLGESAASRSAAAGKTTRWYVESTRDAFGHQMRCRYWTNQGKVYWQGVDYQQEADVAYRNRVEFGYEARPDPFLDYRYGDLEQTGYRLKTIEVWQGPAGQPGAPQGRLLRRYTLMYGSSRLWSLLTEVQMVGENGLGMPSLRFGFLEPTSHSGRFVRTEGWRTLSGLDSGRMTLEDVNGDGLPDLLQGDASSYTYYENIDGVKFSDAGVNLGVSGSPDRNLDSAGVVLADVDGDGYRDVWYPTGTNGQFRYFPGGRIERGRFLGYGAAKIMNGNYVVSDVTKPEIRLTDLNGDGRTDLLYQRSPSGLSDAWVENQMGRDLVQRSMPTLPSGIVLSNSSIELLDFNGDGVLDLVQKEFDGGKHDVLVFYGYGSGKYASEAQAWEAPNAAAKEVFLSDVNRDGQTDLIRVSGSWVGYYLNDGSGRFATQQGDFYGMPETSRTKRLLLADMNGNGTTDVVWLTVDGEMEYLDLMEEPNAGLLSRVDNGMGMVTDISYRSSTDYEVDAKLGSAPWKSPMPHPVPVVAEVATRDSLEKLGVGGWESRTTYEYADGYYDTKEREFRGFARVAMTQWGDEYQEGKVMEMRMHLGRNLETGADEESLKGKVWLEVEKTDKGEVLASEETKWEQRWLCQEDLGTGVASVLPSCAGISDKNAHKDELVTLGVQTGMLHGSWERQPTARYTAVKTEYSAWGKPTKVEHYGEVDLLAGHTLGQAWAFSDLKVSVGNDEKVEEHDYANTINISTGTWLIGYPTEDRLKTAAGELAGRIQTYYDGPALEGLSLGQVTQGLVSRRVAWLAEESRWVPVERTAYNTDGLPTQKVDATGYATTLVYDGASRMLPKEERLPLEGGRVAVFSASFDQGYGVVSSLTDPNGQTTQYRYDGLGRLVKIIDPLGADAEPLIWYDYNYGTADHPISTTTVKQLSERGKGVYRTSVVYSDGLGRARLTKTASEQAYVGDGWHTLSAAGGTVRASKQFWSTSDIFEAAPSSTPETVTYSDAQGRPLRQYLPATPELGATYRAYDYRPLETRLYDEKDASEQTLAYPEITRVDGLGRVRELEKKNLAGTETSTLVWTLGYDIRDNLTSFKDPKQFGRTYGYDTLGRLRTLSDPNLGTVQYSYDDANRLTKRVDALGQEIVSEYGASGRMRRQVLQARNPQSNSVRVDAEYLYHYDEAQAGGPFALSSTGTAATNLIGRLGWVEYPIGSEHYSYDERGQLVSEAVVLWDGLSPVSPASGQLRTTHVESRTYNAAGQEATHQLPGGFGLTTTYDARGLVQRLTGGLPQDTRDVVQKAIYDQRGLATQVDQGNGLRLCRKYNARDQLAGVMLGKAKDVTCAAEEYERTAFGTYHVSYGWGHDAMLSAIADKSAVAPDVPRWDASYGYDRLHQLVSATSAQGNWEYGYDTIQNLTKIRSQQGTATAIEKVLTYGEGGVGPNAATHAGATPLEYDAVGQLKQYNGYELKFDELGQLVEASKSGGKRLQYFYNPFGERRVLVVTPTGGVAKDVYRYPIAGYEERAGDVVWRIQGHGPEVELHQAKGLRVDAMLLDELTAYVNAPAGKSKPLPAEWLDLDGDGDGFDAGDLAAARQAFWNSQPAGTSRLEWRFTQRDHLSSSVVVTDRIGDPVSTRYYEPYGATAHRSGVQPTMGYAGAEVEPDEDLGLIRMGARYYAPGLGRWITPDRYVGESPGRMAKRPLDAGIYNYAGNNPVIYIDPTGLLQFEVGTIAALRHNPIKAATSAMTARMQTELTRDFGIATTKVDDWNGSDLHLADPTALASAKSAAEARMRAAGASASDIAKWNIARDRLVNWVGSDRVISITVDSAIRGADALIGGETSPHGGVSMNPYTWFDASGKDIELGSLEAKAQMGPAITLLHETDHVEGCMSGAIVCKNTAGTSMVPTINPEQSTVDDLNDHLKGVPGVAVRPYYGVGRSRPGGDLPLKYGDRWEDYRFPSLNQLRNGVP